MNINIIPDYTLQLQIDIHDHADLESDQRRRQVNLKIERIHLRSLNVYRFTDTQFKDQFRVNKNTFRRIVEELTPFLKETSKSDGIAAQQKVCVRF